MMANLKVRHGRQQYNNDAVHINDIVGNFNKMSFELKQSTSIIKGC